MTRLLFVSIPGLTLDDISSGSAPFLGSVAEQGGRADLVPSLPAVACTVQADMLTGRRAYEHGMVADAFYDRASYRVLCRPQYSAAVESPRLWDLFKAHEVRSLCAVLFFEQTMYAKADIVVCPDPVIMEDGGLLSRCYSKPRLLYPELVSTLRWFDLESYEGRSDSQAAMRWISGAAEYILKQLEPRLTMVRFPHLDHALTRHGSGSSDAKKVLSLIDALLGHLVVRFRAEERNGAVVVVSEYGFSNVSGAVHINRELRNEGMLSVQEIGGREFIDFEVSRAFAVTDYQVAHVYCRDDYARDAAKLVRNLRGVQAVLDVQEKRRQGLEHARSGELIAISEPKFWFTYNWWLDDALAPSFPRQGSPAKPGLDPLELFVQSGVGYAEVPGDVSLVKGSHGLTPEFGGMPGMIICDSVAARELKANRMPATGVIDLLGHLLR